MHSQTQHTNIRAGGAVGGGVAAIGAAAAVIFFMLRRFKRGKYQAPHNTNEPGSPLYGDKRLSQHTATPYGSPTPMYTPTMGSSHLPDPYGRPGSYQYNPINNQRYQPYRPPPAELPYNPSMPHELPER